MEADEVGEDDCGHCSYTALTTRLSNRQLVEFPDTVEVIEWSEDAHSGTLYLVGTAHFSRESQEDVRNVINKVQPDAVLIELCQARISILQMDEDVVLEQAKDLGYQKIMDSIKENGVFQGVLNVLLLNMSASLTKQLGMAPGGEFRVAVHEAQKVPGCQITLGDRQINVTLQRAWGNLSCFQKLRLATALLMSTKQTIKPDEVEKCKNRDILEELLAQLAGEFPALTRVLVEERDLYMTCVLRNLMRRCATDNRDAVADHGAETPTHPVVVGVVGIGHVKGIRSNWSRDINANELTTMSKLSPLWPILSVTFKLGFHSVSVYCIFKCYRCGACFSVPKPSPLRPILSATFKIGFISVSAYCVFKCSRFLLRRVTR